MLEVRDARIPFSSANPELENLVRQKRRLIVLNKADLAAPDKQQVGSITLLHVTLLHALHACAMTTRYASVLALTVVCFLKRLHAFQLRCASDAGCFAPVTGAAAVSPVHQQSEAWQHPTAVAHHHPKAESRQIQCRHAHNRGCR